MEIVRYVLAGVSILAGFSVLRNPIREPINTLAGLTYFAGAAGTIILAAWWPVLVGWIGSLFLQGVSAFLIAKGVFNDRINAERAKKGLPPLSRGAESSGGEGI